MEGTVPQLLLVAVLVLANAAFAGSELALVSLREGQLRRLETRGGSGQVLARLAREPNRFLATIQIGITLAGFLASALGRTVWAWVLAAIFFLAVPAVVLALLAPVAPSSVSISVNRCR